jgi:predicted small lipoprotein YifL
MKQSFLAISTLIVTFALTLVACSKKGWLPTDETTVAPVRIIPAAKNDTPYGKNNVAYQVVPPVKDQSGGIVLIPESNNDTPYGRNNSTLYNSSDDAPTGINIIPASKSDTPYGK